MKTLQECLTGYYPGFHGKEHLYELMTKHSGFHAGNEIWFVRDVWAAGQFLIFQVRFGPETSSMPYGPDNEVGEVISFIDLNLNSFISAVVCMTNDNTNYDKVLELFCPKVPISDPLEEQPTCPCTILDEPCAPHCTCKEPFSSRGCYLCAQYGSEEQRKAKAKWIKERVMSTVLEEQPDKGWIPVSEETMPDMVQALWIADKEGYMYEEMFKYFPNNVEGFSPYFYGYISKNILTLDDVGFYMFPQAPVKQG